MLDARCLFCRSQIAANTALEHFPRGRRVAFDPVRGRLWAVCGACGGWNLAAFERRWEALEELERLATGRARQLAGTGSISLLELPGVELVRVGAAPTREEAWWRYGRELRGRRRRAAALLALDVVIAPVFSFGARRQAFGRFALGAGAPCPRCGWAAGALTHQELGRAELLPGEAAVVLALACPRCGDRRRLAAGQSAQLTATFLKWAHFSGAAQRTVDAALGAIEASGSATALVRGAAEGGGPLWRLEMDRPVLALALEVALNDERERRLLAVELHALEAAWREAEAVAAIADGELMVG